MHHTHLSNLPPIQMFFLVAVLFLGLAMYFFPSIMAIKRNSPHTTAVVILNLFFGFTLVGWIVALVLASKQPQPVVIVYQTPPPSR
ncbi:MAG TPA: superinfection immunity protein [Candidatus Angelobacter sp.]|nr:superinfection immunity protein [Candidatus Angelobacter sp.]